jgi:hypothetical protein
MCCDGSKRATPELRFAQMYVLCIDQPCVRVFFALSVATGFVVMGADRTNANAQSPSYVRIADAYADWYRSRQEGKLSARWY